MLKSPYIYSLDKACMNLLFFNVFDVFLPFHNIWHSQNWLKIQIFGFLVLNPQKWTKSTKISPLQKMGFRKKEPKYRNSNYLVWKPIKFCTDFKGIKNLTPDPPYPLKCEICNTILKKSANHSVARKSLGGWWIHFPQGWWVLWGEGWENYAVQGAVPLGGSKI